MEIFYLFILVFIMIVTCQLYNLLMLQDLFAFFICANLWFMIIMNWYIEKKRVMVKSKVSENGLIGARMLGLVINVFLICPVLAFYRRNKIFYIILIIAILLIVMMRNNVEIYFLQNHCNINIYIMKLLMESIAISLFVITYDINPLFKDMEIAEPDKLTFILMETAFIMNALILPRNSLLARLSTKLYKKNAMIEDGNDMVD